MKEALQEQILFILYEIASLDSEIILLAVLLVVGVIVIDAASAIARRQSKKTGLEIKNTAVSVDGSKTIAIKTFVSDMQGLAGRPDALIVENGFVIPIERKPLARKIRDRYVAQLLVYMRLVEEFEGKKPPYGYLILGPNCRRVKIGNTPERQAWLQNMINDMRGILEHKLPSSPDPHPKKCCKCVVRNSCSSRVDEAARTAQAEAKRKAVG